MLHLVAIRAQRPVAQRLWEAVIKIAVTREGADGFTIDSTTLPGRSKDDREQDGRLLESLGILPDQQCELAPIAGKEKVLAKLGLRVLSINLYSGRAWVAGVSDWGDDIDALLSDGAWVEAQRELELIVPAPIVDIAEVAERPVLAW